MKITAMRIKADFSVPIPRLLREPQSRDRFIYPWDTMHVGQSFPVPKNVIIGHFRRQAWDAGRKFDRKFSVRKMKRGHRCFRVA